MPAREPATAGLSGNQRLRPGIALSLLLRSFFLQAAWSYDRMQSVGFAAAIAGEGRRIVPPAGGAEFLKRHLAYFNTNPVLSSYILGGVVRLEEELARGAATPESVVRFKRAMASSLAAWGDTLFWATLRPAATAIGGALAILAGAWGVAGYLVVYNAPHFYYRIRGLGDGYRYVTELGGRLSVSPLRTLPVRIRRGGLLALAFLAAFSLTGSVEAAGTVRVLAILAASAGVFAALKWRAGLGSWWGLLAVLIGLAQAGLTRGR